MQEQFYSFELGLSVHSSDSLKPLESFRKEIVVQEERKNKNGDVY